MVKMPGEKGTMFAVRGALVCPLTVAVTGTCDWPANSQGT
jgi:hypothetical protein